MGWARTHASERERGRERERERGRAREREGERERERGQGCCFVLVVGCGAPSQHVVHPERGLKVLDHDVIK